jgi:hypothetical protein
MAVMAGGKPVRVKKRCCKDKPRCKKCPVVCKRLMNAGLAEPTGKGRFVVIATKPQVKAARKGKPIPVAA